MSTMDFANWMSVRAGLPGRTVRTIGRAVRTACIPLLTAAIVAGASPAVAQAQDQVRGVFQHALPNVPGKRMVAVVVNYPPGGKSPAHHHAASAFIYAYVLSGAIRSKVDDDPEKVYRAGEGFYEMPGSHHRVSENASETEPASLLAVFIVDAKDGLLTTPDRAAEPR